MAAKKSVKSAKVQTRRRKNKRTWSRYVSRVLKNVHKGITISGKAMNIVNSFVNDIFDRVAVEAGSVARNNKAKTLSSRAVQAAVRLALPGDLAGHAIIEGQKAVGSVAK